MSGTRAARLDLLGGFELSSHGTPVELPPGSQRVVAYVGVAGGTASRHAIQADLWPDREDRRAAANLRTAVWRLPSEFRWVVEVDRRRVQLADTVRCDVVEMVDRARSLLVGNPAGAARLDPGQLDAGPFLDDLLPAWYEDWVLVERERLRQLRIHALEKLATFLSELGRHAEALEAALAAVTAEPLRETAQRALIIVHLAEGNASEALRQYESYRRLLFDNLGVEPSTSLQNFIADATGR
jgi:DNA-binding SARP family transcriptional activator